MKKYLMTVMAAVTLGGLFTGCNSVDADVNGGNNSAEFNIVQNYEDAFVTRFGQPAANQTWGFGPAVSGTRGSIGTPYVEYVGPTFNAQLSAMSDKIASAIGTGTDYNYFSQFEKYHSWLGSGWNDVFYNIHASVVASDLTDEYLAKATAAILKEIPEGGANLSKAQSTGYSITTKGGPVTITPIYHNSNSGDKISYYYYPTGSNPTPEQIKALPKYTIGNMADPSVCNDNHTSLYRNTYSLVYVNPNDPSDVSYTFPEGLDINFIITNTWVGNGNLTIYDSGGITTSDGTPSDTSSDNPSDTPSDNPSSEGDFVPGNQIFKFEVPAGQTYYCGEYAEGGPYSDHFVRMGNGGQQDYETARNENYQDFGEAHSNKIDGYTAYSPGNGINGDLTKLGTTVYYIHYHYNNTDGLNRSVDEFMARVGIVINKDTPLYVVELNDKNDTSGTPVEGFNGKTYSEKTNGVIEFRLKQGKTYAIYATGSKLGFYGCEVLFENSKRPGARTRGTRGTSTVVTKEIPNNPEYYGDGRLNRAIHASGIDQWKLSEGYEATPHVAVFQSDDFTFVGFEDWTDLDYNDVIFAVPGTTGGDPIEIPEPEPENNDPEGFVCRIIAEDLTVGENSDFDFNDVVFDVYWSGGVTTIRLLAAGGELPLYIGSVDDAHEVHKLFGFPNSYPLINTNWKEGKTAAPVEFTISGTYSNRAACKNIPIYVTKKGENIQLKADQGKVASMVAVGLDYEWCDERLDIDKKFRSKDGTKLFQQYVIGKLGDDWDGNKAWYQYRGKELPND